MKNKLFSFVLCLLLIYSMIPTATAATLDTADIEITGNQVIIGSGNETVLTELNNQGRTAKIAVPYDQANVYVLKDNSLVVAHNWDKTGFIQFEVPDAGIYVITPGAPEPLEEQMQAGKENVIITSGSNFLTNDHTVKDGTVIHVNNKTIQGTRNGNTLTAEGTLQIEKINGVEDILLDAGDKITFDAEGDATVLPSLDKSVGYGRFRITRRINGKEVTQTCFLVEGETLTITKEGRISGNTIFAMGGENDELPPYELQFDAHDNSHVHGESGKLVVRCNGMFDYYSFVTITLPDSSSSWILAEKVDGMDITVPGVKISEGSTVLTLESSYLNTLNTGTYTITFHYADGGTISEPLQIMKQASIADPTNPKTGDFFGRLFAGLFYAETENPQNR